MTAGPTSSGASARPVIPANPGSVFGARPRLKRRSPPPPSLTSSRDPDAFYVLDSGVGLAFASISGGMDLLQVHYREQLRYVDEVMFEWETQAGWSSPAPGPGHTPEQRADWLRRRRVKLAARLLVTEMPARFGEPAQLELEEAAEIDSLVAELQAFPPPKPGGADRGECASVRYGELLRSAEQARVIVMCANDDRAQRLAGNHGIAHRDMARVLTEMVHENRLTKQQAFTHYEVMSKTTELRVSRRPAGPDDFA